MTRDLSGDFITDHPFVSVMLGLGAVSLINGISQMSDGSRYDIQERERRKEALRRRFMAQHPFHAPVITAEGLKSFFLEDMDDEEFNKMDNNYELLVEEMVKRWNAKTYGRTNRIRNDLPYPEKLKEIYRVYMQFSSLSQHRNWEWKKYVEWVEDQLFLRGEI